MGAVQLTKVPLSVRAFSRTIHAFLTICPWTVKWIFEVAERGRLNGRNEVRSNADSPNRLILHPGYLGRGAALLKTHTVVGLTLMRSVVDIFVDISYCIFHVFMFQRNRSVLISLVVHPIEPLEAEAGNEAVANASHMLRSLGRIIDLDTRSRKVDCLLHFVLCSGVEEAGVGKESPCLDGVDAFA